MKVYRRNVVSHLKLRSKFDPFNFLFSLSSTKDINKRADTQNNFANISKTIMTQPPIVSNVFADLDKFVSKPSAAFEKLLAGSGISPRRHFEENMLDRSWCV